MKNINPTDVLLTAVVVQLMVIALILGQIRGAVS